VLLNTVRSGDFNAIVIGSGAGGASLALRLAERGLKVLLVEKGDYLRPARPSGAVGLFIGDVQGERGAPITCVGGQTKFYGAALYRLREADFAEIAHERGVSPAWPISYADLEPYYGQAEQLFRVHGAPDGDPSEPPRSAPYPHPPIEHAPLVAKMVGRLERTGRQVAAIPRGLDRRSGDGKCVLCATCDAHYCSLDAKMDAEIAAVRPALATGNVVLSTRTECLKILTDAPGTRAVGAVLRRDGVEREVRAETVAICAGIPTSALLLRRSRTDAHRSGLGNQGGALGRYLAAHSTGMIFPFVSGGRVRPTHTKTFAINEFYAAGPHWPHPLGVIQIAGQTPFWNEASAVVRPIARFVGAHSFTCFYMTEALPTPDTGIVFEGDEIARSLPPVQNLESFAELRRKAVRAFRRAGYLSLARRRAPYVWHEVGTARMGADPSTSVVDPDLQVHGVEGLYVADASVLPSAGAVNTALTIVALALRAGDHIASQADAALGLDAAAAGTRDAAALAHA